MVALAKYVPDRGDIVWLSLDPTRGHEQRGHRPLLVLSPRSYNERAELALMCPMTTRSKGYPFELNISEVLKDTVVLTDQVRSIDWKERKAEYHSHAPPHIVNDVLSLISTLLAI